MNDTIKNPREIDNPPQNITTLIPNFSLNFTPKESEPKRKIPIIGNISDILVKVTDLSNYFRYDAILIKKIYR